MSVSVPMIRERLVVGELEGVFVVWVTERKSMGYAIVRFCSFFFFLFDWLLAKIVIVCAVVVLHVVG